MSYRVKKYQGTQPPDARAMVHAMETEGYRVLEWSDRPGISYGGHRHEEDQSHLIISGQIEFVVEGHGTVTLGPGDRDYMPAGTMHSARVVGDEPVFYLIGSRI
jgi:quercetin dioxygenase-like cupin family protein